MPENNEDLRKSVLERFTHTAESPEQEKSRELKLMTITSAASRLTEFVCTGNVALLF